MSAYLFIEGGGDSKDLHVRCREGFHKLLAAGGFAGRMPRLVACGSRNATFDRFNTAHSSGQPDFAAMLVDSEDPIADIEKPWDHLRNRDRWAVPAGATDEQVLLMVTCMETWLVADRKALKGHYGSKLKESALPATVNLEARGRHDVQDALANATRDCRNCYAKGKRSFDILAKLDPAVLRKHLPSFARACDVLQRKV